jgi:lipopolysaccharide export system protein LptA
MRFLLPAILAALLCLPAAAQVAAQVGFGNGDFDRSAPVDVAADMLEIDQQAGRAVLTDNVVIVQGDMRLSADLVVIDYIEVDGAQEIQQIDASGDVLLIAGADAAEGETALYELGTSDVLMTGDVVVTQGGTTVSGDVMTLNLASGAGTVTGRVRTTLQP